MPIDATTQGYTPAPEYQQQKSIDTIARETANASLSQQDIKNINSMTEQYQKNSR